MSVLESERSLVLVIDMQGRLMSLVHRPELVLAATERLLQIADLFAVPTLVTEQYPTGLGETHPRIEAAFAALAVAKKKVVKDSFSCCGEPSFEEALAELRPELGPASRQIVVAGVETHVCVVQTVLGLLAQGSEVQVAWDCTSGRGDEYRGWALERMQQAGATITNHESVAFEWARDRHHDSFRQLNRLLRQGQPGAGS